MAVLKYFNPSVLCIKCTTFLSQASQWGWSHTLKNWVKTQNAKKKKWQHVLFRTTTTSWPPGYRWMRNPPIVTWSTFLSTRFSYWSGKKLDALLPPTCWAHYSGKQMMGLLQRCRLAFCHCVISTSGDWWEPLMGATPISWVFDRKNIYSYRHHNINTGCLSLCWYILSVGCQLIFSLKRIATGAVQVQLCLRVLTRTIAYPDGISWPKNDGWVI